MSMSYILILTIHADPAMPPGYDEWGGTHTYMKELLDSFDSLHIKCVLVTRRSMKELPEVEQYNQYCTIYRLKNGEAAPIDKTKLYTYHQENLRNIQQIIQDIGSLPKVIHSVYWNSGRLGVELSKIYNIPLVHSVISNSYGRQSRGACEPIPKRAEYEQLIYEYAQWILCVSEDEKNDLIKYYNISSKKIIVAGQYIHPSFIIPSRDKNGFPRLNSNISKKAQASVALQYNNAFEIFNADSFWAHKAFTYFGRIDENKGVDHILNAWCSLYQKYQSMCPPLWLIGGSVKEISDMRTKCKEIESLLLKAEQENKIIWWGCLDAIGASTLLLKTLVLVTNSLYEPGGRVVTEAMSEGVPVIAAPNGFALDLICDWKNGFLVNHGDEQSLAARMEHFIRQPFLSDALGENARQDADNVMIEWDFIGKHLKAYGYNLASPQATNTAFNDYFLQRKITLCPYKNLPFSSQFLYTFVEKFCKEQILSITLLKQTTVSSDIYYVQGAKNPYIIKHPYTRLALSSLVLPNQRFNYVRNASDFYKYEVAAYETHESDILIGKDDLHQLLLLRKTDPFIPTPDDYHRIFEFLKIHCRLLSDANTHLYNDTLFNTSPKTIENIDALLDDLSTLFPDFYFDPNCSFLPYIAWNLAPYILEYNKVLFSEQQYTFLHKFCDTFTKSSELCTKMNWYVITSDITLQNMVLNHAEIYSTNCEKRTIGRIEYMAADILLDILIHEIKESSNTWITLLEHEIPKYFNKQQVLESLAYKLFFKTILNSVMQNQPILSYFNALDTLLSIKENS